MGADHPVLPLLPPPHAPGGEGGGASDARLQDGVPSETGSQSDRWGQFNPVLSWAGSEQLSREGGEGECRLRTRTGPLHLPLPLSHRGGAGQVGHQETGCPSGKRGALGGSGHSGGVAGPLRPPWPRIPTPSWNPPQGPGWRLFLTHGVLVGGSEPAPAGHNLQDKGGETRVREHPPKGFWEFMAPGASVPGPGRA